MDQKLVSLFGGPQNVSDKIEGKNISDKIQNLMVYAEEYFLSYSFGLNWTEITRYAMILKYREH